MATYLPEQMKLMERAKKSRYSITQNITFMKTMI